MANDKNNVKVNRLVMVEPNLENNGLVPHEDLSIVVDLETVKKGRDLISVVKNVGYFEQTTDKTLRVRFFEGSEINGQQTLTTNYTNIGNSYKNVTTTFNKKGENLEGLGITDIDIEFNSSYTPLIKINFIDIRGNEILERGNESRYSVFFNLPYPIFKLTIKGYYGQAVTYCLHLTKWNALFNSETGNFEIQCDFIGHTYAFLTDMLIGYLRAAAETKSGKDLLAKKIAENPNIMSINELIKKISELNTYLSKLKKAPNSSIKELATIEDKIVELETIESSLDNFKTIIINNSSKNRSNNVIGDDGDELYVISTKDKPSADYDSLIKDIDDYEELLPSLIDNVNNSLDGSLQLDKDNFIYFLSVEAIVKDFMNETQINYSNPIETGITKANQIYVRELGEEKYKIVYEILKNKLDSGAITENTRFIVLDLSKGYNELEEKTNELERLRDENKELVADELAKNVKSEVGLDPTIRNIFTILATHVDIFMQLIRECASKANNNKSRDDKFKKYLNKLDIKTITAGKTSNGLPSKIYPFPFYQKDGKESWIGKEISNIPETNFVEELIEGFLKNAETDRLIGSELNSMGSTWYPINVLDTPLYNTINPYEEIKDSLNYDPIISRVIERAFIFLHYSSPRISELELSRMAKIEAESVLEYISDEIILRAMVGVSGNTISEKAQTLIDSYDKKNGNSFGTFDCGDDNVKIKSYYLNNNINVNNEGKLRYGKYLPYVNNTVDTDTTYLDILTEEKYKASTGVFPSYDAVSDYKATDNIIDLDLVDRYSLDIKDYGKSIPEYNSLNGVYGITEFFNVRIESGGPVYPSESLFWSSLTQRIHKPRTYTGLFVGNKNTTSSVEINNEYGTTNPKGANQIFTIVNFNTNELESIDKQFIGFQSFKGLGGTNGINYSLFGSELYFRQSENLQIPHPKYKTLEDRRIVANRARAILFLHSLPFDGLWGYKGLGLLNNNKDKYSPTVERNGYNTYGSLKLALFDRRGGFVKIPRAWLLLVGGLLWRYQEVENGDLSIDPIRFAGQDFLSGTSQTKYFIHDISDGNHIPGHMEYLKQVDSDWDLGTPFDEAICFSDEEYVPLEDVFRNLPKQAKDTLIKFFTDWTDGKTEGEFNWNAIRNVYEIEDLDSITSQNLPKRVKDREIIWKKISEEVKKIPSDKNQSMTASEMTIKMLETNGYKNLDKCSFIAPNSGRQTNVENTDINFGTKPNYDIYYVKTAEDKTNGIRDTITSLVEPLVVANSTWRIWGSDPSVYKSLVCTYTHHYTIKDTVFKKYLETFLTTLNEKLDSKGLLEKREDLKKEAFGVLDNDLIKLNIYRTIKAIYDKWIAGDDPNIKGLFDCLTGSEGDLISTFRFLDKSFRDIGDDFLINPLTILNQIQTNTNQSFYDFISRILVDNNFDFIALPNFIDYKDENQLKKIFKPIPYVEYVEEKTIGPTFICMYIGQTSKHLDLNDSDYEGDALLLDVNTELPDEFSEPSDYTIPAFGVNYAQGNQSIFKNIKLDQSEFSETDESLKIIDSLSLQGDSNNRVPVGQNLWNVFSVRSYTAEVEMMGNAMIQPIMYFQLNNIPMFRGGYLITKVTHRLKPNDMSTTFKGVRVSKYFSPLIDETELYMNLLGSLDEVDIKGVKVSSDGTSQMVIDARNIEPEDIAKLNFGYPETNMKISCGIGPRIPPTKGASSNHKGIDVTVNSGTNLFAIQDGVIELIRLRNGYGLQIITKHVINGVTWRALYAHLSDVSKEATGLDLNNLTAEEKYALTNAGITPNKEVKKGVVIAKSGGSGDKQISGIKLAGTSTGGHLHFEIREERSPNIPGTWDAYTNNSIVRDPAQLLGITKYDTKSNQNQSKETLSDEIAGTNGNYEFCKGVNIKPSSTSKIIFSDDVSLKHIPKDERVKFINKVRNISVNLSINPNWLMMVMYNESGLNPAIENSIGCVGLIQFCPDGSGLNYKTLNGKKYYLSDIKNMGWENQLNLINTYYETKKGKFNSYADLALYTFFPAAIGKPDNWVFESKNNSKEKIAKQNSPMAVPGENYITMRSYKNYLYGKVPENVRNDVFCSEGYA